MLCRVQLQPFKALCFRIKRKKKKRKRKWRFKGGAPYNKRAMDLTAMQDREAMRKDGKTLREK